MLGNILSPLLYNLYLTPLDDYIDNLKKKYDIIIPTLARSRNNPHCSRGGCEAAPAAKKSNIYYVRYLDSWVIGVIGSYSFSNKIKEEINNFLENELKLGLLRSTAQHCAAAATTSLLCPYGREAPFLPGLFALPYGQGGAAGQGGGGAGEEVEKIKIFNLKTEFVKFLGYYLKLPATQPLVSASLLKEKGLCVVAAQQKISKNKGRHTPASEVKPSKSSPLLLIPLNDLKLKLIEKGFADKSGRPKYVGKYIFLSDYDIVKEYNCVLIKIITFFSLANNCYRLSEITYILEFSLAHTLAAKHRTSLTRVFKKYGRPFLITRGEKYAFDSIKFAKPVSYRFDYLNKIYIKSFSCKT